MIGLRYKYEPTGSKVRNAIHRWNRIGCQVTRESMEKGVAIPQCMNPGTKVCVYVCML